MQAYRIFAIILIGTAAGALLLNPAAAQEAAPRAGAVWGRVLDAESSRPLTGAVVTLEPAGTAALPGADGEAFVTAERATISDAEGNYRFAGLPPGRYRIRISRVGYRAAAVSVELRGSADSRISVGLTVEPVTLEPVAVEGVSRDSYGRGALAADAGSAGESRVAAARARQSTYLSSDVREITHSDVVESVTLGETDLFRALHRAPGVGARDDYGADLWVRGASWDQTRVYFDGLPLFNPVHAFGLLSAVNTDAIGGALLHPGVRSASLGDAAAAVLDVTTRTGRPGGEVRGLADVSLASGRLALDGSALDSRASWMIAGRRSWLDLATLAAAALASDPQLELPYSFSDLTARVDVDAGEGRVIEASALRERDRINGTIPDILHRTRASWGNTAGRVTVAAPVRDLESRTTFGVSRFGAGVRRADPDSLGEGGFSAAEAIPSDNRLTHLSVSSEVSPASAGRVRPWRVGAGLVHEQGRYAGPEGWAYGRFRAGDADSLLELSATVTRAVLWGERRWGADLGLSLESGLRLEVGSRVGNGGIVRAAPRATARYAPSADFALSAGVGRSFQYTQALSAADPVLAAGHAASNIWLVADEQAPAIRADVATLGAELWVGGTILLTANSYLRHSTGIAVPDPTPGLAIDRPLFLRAENDASGLELSARRLAGRWTASTSYTLASSTNRTAGLEFPAAEDRRHTFDMTSMLRVARSLRLGAAFTYASGAPYTRIHARVGDCADGVCASEILLEEPNAQRAGPYSSLDLLLDWTTRLGGWDVGVYLQLRNALGHRNDVTFNDSYLECDSGWTPENGCTGGSRFRDQFERGLPTLPLIGFRARF